MNRRILLESLTLVNASLSGMKCHPEPLDSGGVEPWKECTSDWRLSQKSVDVLNEGHLHPNTGIYRLELRSKPETTKLSCAQQVNTLVDLHFNNV